MKNNNKQLFLVSVVTCSFKELIELPINAPNKEQAEELAMRNIENAHFVSAVKLAAWWIDIGVCALIHFNDRLHKDLVLKYCYQKNGIENQSDAVEYAIENGLFNSLGHLTFAGLSLAGGLKTS